MKNPILPVLLLGCAAFCSAQTDIYVPYRNKNMWTADTLYLGAGFARMSNKPVTIWLVGNEAGWEGQLFYVDPVTGAETFLLTNMGTPGIPVELTALANVPIGQNLTFMYKVVSKKSSDMSIDKGKIRTPKYTGPNRRNSHYFSQATSDVNNNPSLRFGHRWSVAGRLAATRLEFGFEDNTEPASDMDFDDIIFGVDGLTLVNFERTAKVRSYVW